MIPLKRIGATTKLIVMVILLWSYLPTHAQDATDDGKAQRDRIKELETTLAAEDKKNGRAAPELAPVLVPAEFLDAEGQQALKNSLRSYYEYRIQGFEHRQSVFEWQLLSSKVIFVVVVLLVSAGVYFSWLQFQIEMKRKASDDGYEGSTSTIEASSTGIKVSSPILGVIILVISLLFFYLYLVHVYRIEEIL